MRKSKNKTTRVLLAGATFLAGFGVLTARADYATTVTAQKPVAYWQLNEAASPGVPVTTAANLGSLGAGQNGTYNGSQAFFRSVNGAFGTDKAAHFDGTSQAVQSPYNTAMSTAPFTAEAWLAPDLVGSAVPGGLTAALCSFDASNGRAGWLLYQSTTGWSLRLYNQNGNATSLNLLATNLMTAGTYYHIVVTFDGTTARVYSNGVLLNSGSPVGSTPYVPATAGPFSIGTRSDNAFYWAGRADEVAYYGTVLNQSDISAHYDAATTNTAGYAAQIGLSSPLLYFRLNEAGGSGVANSGTLGAAAPAEVNYPGLLNQPGPAAPAFPGFSAGNTGFSDNSGGYIQSKALNLNTNTVTMTCWVKPNGSQAGKTGILMSRARLAAGGAYSSTAGLIVDAGGGLNLAYNWDGDDGTYSWASGIGLADATWNFAALIIEPTKATLCIHNGTTFQTAVNVLNHASLRFEGPLYMGMDPYTSVATTPRKFVGSLDEVAVFKRALSVGEVYTEYATAVGSLPPILFTDLVAPSGTTYAGDPLTLTVDAGGTADLSIQWRKGGAGIADATNLFYTIASLVPGDNGSYDCIISNPHGSTNSSAVAVTVAPQVSPSVTTDITTTSRVLYTSGAINLGVTATGGGLQYQWQKDGVDIAGKTNSTLQITGLSLTNAGSYKLRIINTANAVESATAIIAVASGSPNSYEAAIAADSPISWWRMDDAPNSPIMLDSMGRGDGQYLGAVVLGAPGALVGNANKAAHFDLASQGYGEVYPPTVTTGDITIEAWVRVTNTSPVDLYPVSSFRNQYGFFMRRGDDFLWHNGDGYGDLDGSTPNRAGAQGPADAGKWYHLVQVYSGASGYKSYVNGIWDGNGPYVDFSRNLNTPLKIGSVIRSGLTSYFDGEVDEVALYNKALSDARISAHYSAGVFGTTTVPFFLQQPASQVVRLGTTSASFTGVANGSSPISYQWFKNGSPINGSNATTLTVPITGILPAPDQYQLRATNSAGTNFSAVASLTVMPTNPSFINATNDLVLHLKVDSDFLDSSGRGNNATAVGAPTLVPGKLGNAVHVATTNADPINNYLTLGTPADFQFSTNVNFSVAYWVYYPSGWLNGDLPFLANSTNSYGNPGVTIAPSYNLGGWSYSLNGFAQIYGPDNSINNGSWHHMVHSFDRTGYGTTYRDGVQVDQRLVNTVGNVDTGAPYNIGQDASGIYAEDGFADLDDIGVWRRALTAYDAYAMYYVANTFGKSFDTYGPVTLSAKLSGSDLQVIWQAGTLVESTDPALPLAAWTPVVGATAPSFIVTPSGAAKFYAVRL